jgi:hypothetical protein
MRLYTVTDDLGSFAMLWDEPVPPRSSTKLNLTWTLVAEVATLEEAYAVLDRLGLGPSGVSALRASSGARSPGSRR